MGSAAGTSHSTEAPALNRGLAVLEWIVRAGQPVRFGQITEAMGLNPASTARLLRTLIGRGYLQQNEAGRYTPGPRCAALQPDEGAWPRLKREVEPVLASLVAETGNSAIAFGWSGRHIQSLAKRVHPDAPAMQPIGNVSDQLLKSPWGWIALADLPAGQRATWARRTGASQQQIQTTLRRIQADLGGHDRTPDPPTPGYVLDDLQVIEHVRRLAVPLRDGRRRLVGMLALGGTVHTMPKRSLPTIGRALMRHAATLSVMLGWPDPTDPAPHDTTAPKERTP